MNYLNRALELKDEIITNRRYLHENPEIGFDLTNTCKYVWNRLFEMGYTPQQCGKSGITATVGNKENGKVILLRADMDALPMQEESALPFASKNGNDHACGHDLHTAMLLGAAKMLKENEENLQGTVKLMFQPAEEILEGAKSMIEAGILENPHVDAAIGTHMLPLAPSGVILYNTGAVTASSDSFSITITGKGGHGSEPNSTIDPINVAAHLHIALQELISREADPKESVVLTVGMLQAGDAHNIIPETALMRGTLRTFNNEVREFMLERMADMTKHISEAFCATAKFEIISSTGSLIVDEQTADTIGTGLRQMLGEDAVIHADRTASGSEDFSEISLHVPTMFYALGAGSKEEGYDYGLHNPKVIFNEDSLPIGAAAYAQGATEWLKTN